MKKYLLLLLIMLSGGLVWAEKLPQVGWKNDFNPQENPIIYAYMKDYVDQLYKAFDARKFGRTTICSDPKYILYKNGTVSEPITLALSMLSGKNLPYDEYAKSIIRNNPPPPFPQGMEVEQVEILTWFCKDKYEEVDFEYYPHKSGFTIHIIKDYRNRK